VNVLRIALAGVGVALGCYGAVLLLTGNPPVVLWRIIVWAAAGVLLHDFVFAPVCAAAGWTARRLLPRSVRGPLGVAALTLIVLGLLAIPVYDKPGMHPDNLTVLDRDYHLSVLLATAGVVSALLWWLLAARLLPVGQDEVVERQRADHVERQPPAV